MWCIVIHQAVRRELEKQRHSEWEKQRRDQLMADKQRERLSVDKLRLEVGQLRKELSTLVSEWATRVDLLFLFCFWVEILVNINHIWNAVRDLEFFHFCFVFLKKCYIEDIILLLAR